MEHLWSDTVSTKGAIEILTRFIKLFGSSFSTDQALEVVHARKIEGQDALITILGAMALDNHNLRGAYTKISLETNHSWAKMPLLKALVRAENDVLEHVELHFAAKSRYELDLILSGSLKHQFEILLQILSHPTSDMRPTQEVHNDAVPRRV